MQGSRGSTHSNSPRSQATLAYEDRHRKHHLENRRLTYLCRSDRCRFVHSESRRPPDHLSYPPSRHHDLAHRVGCHSHAVGYRHAVLAYLKGAGFAHCCRSAGYRLYRPCPTFVYCRTKQPARKSQSVSHVRDITCTVTPNDRTGALRYSQIQDAYQILEVGCVQGDNRDSSQELKCEMHSRSRA